MATNRIDALVLWATGDVAKLETSPALAGLVQQEELHFPAQPGSDRLLSEQDAWQDPTG